MTELLLIYTSYALLKMPFQDNYWLWKTIGFAGIGTFGTRFLVQWLYSEKHKESKVPPIFWWQSLIGTMLCLAYFLRQQDSVGIAGYVLNVVPYTRNLMLVYRKKRIDLENQAQIPCNHVPVAATPPLAPLSLRERAGVRGSRRGLRLFK